MTERANETRLIEACQRGDREAFRDLFDAHKDRVWSIALYYTGDESLARDVTQQVFLKLFTNISQFRGDASFATWLYRMVVNACLDERRGRRRWVSFDFFHPDGSDGINRDRTGDRGEVAMKELKEEAFQEERFARFEVSLAVKEAIMKLKPKLRMVILLKYFEDLSYEEMAEALGCSTGTVASRLNRGHKALAQKLARLRGAVGAAE
jgi:RNA polymerase sigma-70 factor (ECF subfamily)